MMAMIQKTLVLSKHLRHGNISQHCKYICQRYMAIYDQHGRMDIEVPKASLRNGIPWNNLLQIWERFKTHAKDSFTFKSSFVKRFDHLDQVLYYFRSYKDLEHWYVMNDEEEGGKSWSEFVLSDNGMTAVFRGFQSQHVPAIMLPGIDDHLWEYTPRFKGFSYLQTKSFTHGYNKEELVSLEAYNSFKIRLRGDGRMYQFQLHIDKGLDYYSMYTAHIYTRGGPLWEEITIPFSRFFAMADDGMVAEQKPMNVNNVRSFRFLLNDGNEGPFQLEIDYIAMVKDFSQQLTDEKTEYYDPWKRIIKNIGNV